VAKPSDFFVGVTDFFAVLLPGVAVLYLLRPVVSTITPRPWLPVTRTEGWALFLVLGYIAGHVLHAIGSWLLDSLICGKVYLPRWRASHWQVAQWIREADSSSLRDSLSLRKDIMASATLLGRVYLTNRVNPQGTNYYDWCLSDLRVNSPVAASEVDRLQADSKFFRSMVFMFLLTALVGLWEAVLRVSAGVTVLAIGAAILALFAIWRFCELRWNATKRVYEYYLLLHSPPPLSESAPGPAPGKP